MLLAMGPAAYCWWNQAVKPSDRANVFIWIKRTIFYGDLMGLKWEIYNINISISYTGILGI
jgi:hypothetical protein